MSSSDDLARAAPLPPLPPLSRQDSAALGQRRRGRNLALLVALLALAALFYAIALVKLGPHGMS
jgi:ferric-dicitrate binding protein FerR (iron transport regulator)